MVVEMDASQATDSLKSQKTDPLIFSEHFPDTCICRWISYLGITGWFFSEAHLRCQVHGKKEET